MDNPLIKNLGKYVQLTEHDVTEILDLFGFRKLRKRQYLQQEGEVPKFDYFIARGITRTYEVDEKGQEHIVQFGAEDWWVGDLYGFLTGTPANYNIDCLEDVEVYQISKTNLDLLYERVPLLERHFRILFQNAYLASVKRVSDTLAKTAGERYQEFGGKYPDIEQRVPNHQIASYLGITPQSLSRIRAQAQGRKP